MQTTCYITEGGQPAKYVHKYFDQSTKIMGFVEGKPACSIWYIVQEDGTSWSNMLCVSKEFRSYGYAVDLVYFVLETIARDERVKNKEETFGETRLEMIPFWKKKLGDRYRTVGEKYLGQNGKWQFKTGAKLPKIK